MTEPAVPTSPSSAPVSPPASFTGRPWPVMSIAQAESLLTAAGARFEVEERDVLGVRMRVWKNGPHTLRDIFVGALLPSGAVRSPADASEPSSVFHDRTLLVYDDERVSFAAFQRAVLALAQRFQQEGLQKGERVAIAMRNLPEWPVVYFAAALCGAIVTPLNAWWTGHELAYGLSDSETAVAIVDGERYERIVAHLPSCPSLRRVYVTRGDGSHAAPLAAALEDVLGVPNEWHKLPVFPLPAVEIAAEDPASIFYTSGTTGKPKGALATHRNVATNVVTQSFALARVLLRRGEAPPTPSPNDPQRVALLAVPFFHVTGCNATLLPAVWNGGKVVLMRKWDAELAMQLIERERVTTAGGVPTIAWQLLEHPARPKYDLSSLVTLGYGGAPAASELVRRIQSVFPAANPGNSWGMTETSGTFSSNYAEDYQQRPGSCGIPTATGDFKILSPDTMQPLAAGTVGELWARGPQVIRSYWKKPEASAETFVDGWVRTGDLAYLDEDGFCFVVDRAKDILIRGGENIYCVQVESALYEHPAVMDAAVLGIPHRTLGEEPGAVVYLKPGSSADETELRAFVAERLAAFEVPVRVLFWNEPLPRNPSGKILKRELKAAFTS